MELLEPKEIEVEGLKYVIGKFPATVGREIIAKYPLSNIPKLGDYGVSEEIMLKLMSFVERVTPAGEHIRLTTKALVDNHIPSWEVLVILEAKSLEYNCSFFQNGKASDFFKKLEVLAQRKISEILTNLSAQSSQAGKPPSTN